MTETPTESGGSIEEHIESVMDGEKTVESKLHCQYCGELLEGDDYVTWEIEPTPQAGIDKATLHFCDDDCMESRKQQIIRGAEQ